MKPDITPLGVDCLMRLYFRVLPNHSADELHGLIADTLAILRAEMDALYRSCRARTEEAAQKALFTGERLERRRWLTKAAKASRN